MLLSAYRHGWEPEGAIHGACEIPDFDDFMMPPDYGRSIEGYFYNHFGARVTDSDARSIGLALDKSIKAREPKDQSLTDQNTRKVWSDGPSLLELFRDFALAGGFRNMAVRNCSSLTLMDGQGVY